MASLQGAEQHVSLGKTVPIVNRYHAPVSTTTLYDELDHYASKHTQGLTLIHTLDVTVTHSKTDAYPYFGRRVLPYSKIDDPLLSSLDVTIAHFVVHPTTQPENSWCIPPHNQQKCRISTYKTGKHEAKAKEKFGRAPSKIGQAQTQTRTNSQAILPAPTATSTRHTESHRNKPHRAPDTSCIAHQKTATMSTQICHFPHDLGFYRRSAINTPQSTHRTQLVKTHVH